MKTIKIMRNGLNYKCSSSHAKFNLGSTLKSIFITLTIMMMLCGMLTGVGAQSADASQSVVSGTGTSTFEAGTQVTVSVLAKYANGTTKTTGGDTFVVNVMNQCTKGDSFACEDVLAQQAVLNPEINEIMTDNGDGTYDYTYTADVDGTITVAVYLLAPSGIYAEYFSNALLDGVPDLITIESTIDFDFGLGSVKGVADDVVTARYQFYLKGPITGDVNFFLSADEQAYMYLNGVEVLYSGLLATNNQTINMVADEYYPLEVTYEEIAALASVRLQWSYTGQVLATIPSTEFFYPEYVTSTPVDVVVTCPAATTGFPAFTVCTSVCGDGLKASTETCDDGNVLDGDGCSADCSTIEPNHVCSGGDATTPDTCQECTSGFYVNDASNPTECVTQCGDGLKAGTEVCDDGNTVAGDGCAADCSAVESGYVCSGGSTSSPDTCTSTTGGGGSPTVSYNGDGTVDSGEECDDANFSNGDGCSSQGKIESNHICNPDENGTSQCSECPQGYEPNTDATECEESDLSTISKAASSVGFVVIGTGIGLSIFAAAMGLGAFIGVFAVINFVQLLLILPLLGAYLPDQYVDLCVGFKVLLFNIFFIPFRDIPLIKHIMDELDHSPTKTYLNRLELDSESATVNLLNLAVCLTFVIVFHLIIRQFYKKMVKIEDKNNLQKFFTGLYEFMTFNLYVVIFMLIFLLLCITTMVELYTANFENGGTSTSYVFTMIIFSACTAACVIAFIQWRKTKDYNEFVNMEHFTWLFKGIKGNMLCRSFWVVFLLRRVLLVFICTMMDDAPLYAKILLYCGVQITYNVFVCITRPFERFVYNFVEILCETVYSVICVLLLYYNDEDKWDDGTANTLVIFIILLILAVFIIALAFFIYDMVVKCSENNNSEVQTSARVHPTKKREVKKVIDLNKKKNGKNSSHENLDTQQKVSLPNVRNENSQELSQEHSHEQFIRQPIQPTRTASMGGFHDRVSQNIEVASAHGEPDQIFDDDNSVDSQTANDSGVHLPNIHRNNAYKQSGFRNKNGSR